MFKRILAALCLVMFLSVSVAFGCTMPQGTEILILGQPGSYTVNQDVDVEVLTPKQMEEMGIPPVPEGLTVVIDDKGYIIAVRTDDLVDCD